MKSIQNRFADKISFDIDTGCWNWTASTRNVRGYGQIKYKDKMQLAHRVSWQIFYGEIPDGIFVCHKCDNPKCVNPTHLFLGTNQDNMNDMKAKGRSKGGSPPGELNHQAKLTEENVKKIRTMYKTKQYTQKELASVFGVERTCIGKIVRNQRWITIG
jgi:hypothetical protein